MSKFLFKEGYFEWLCAKVGINLDPNFGQSYSNLAHVLSDFEYYSVVPRDVNRAKDGVRLRLYYDDFCGENPAEDVENYGETASYLEVIVALAMRMQDLAVDGNDGGFTVKKFFWELLRNLRIDHLSDDIWDKNTSEKYVNWVLRTVSERVIRKDGKGGFFPLKDPKIDQREVEIWYQLNAYLLENYSVFR